MNSADRERGVELIVHGVFVDFRTYVVLIDPSYTGVKFSSLSRQERHGSVSTDQGVAVGNREHACTGTPNEDPFFSASRR